MNRMTVAQFERLVRASGMRIEFSAALRDARVAFGD